MEKRGRKYPAASVFICLGAKAIILNQCVLWAQHVGGWVALWEAVQISALVAIAYAVARRTHLGSLMEIERNRKETAIGLNKERQQSEQLKMAGTLAASIAHEIRNPLTSLKGFIQLNKTAASQAYSDIMLSEIDRINDIVNELLVLAKPQGSEYARRELRPLLRNVLTLMNPQAILYNVQLIDSYPQQLESLSVVCAENKLKQVFINVIKNAIEAMPGGGEITVTAAADEEWIRIEFADSGPGIPEEQLERIGEPFISTKERGTGLGLMVCQTILEDHRGSMRFRNRLAGGAIVTVKLPLNGL